MTLAPPLGTPGLAALVIRDRTTILYVIGGFLLMQLSVGVVFRRFSKDTSDYFRAGGQATWWLLGGSAFMQSFSAWAFTGGAGAAFQVGWSMPLMQVGSIAAFAVLAAGTAGWLRQLRCVTGADLVRLRFGAGMEQFAACLGVLTQPIFGGVQLYGLAIFASILLGVNLYLTIAILGFVVLFYLALSGAWAVMTADFIQALVVMPISILLTAVCLWKMGGVGGLLASIGHAGLSTAYAPLKSPEVLASIPGINHAWFTPGFYLMWCLNVVLINNSMANAGRYLNAKDGREARRAALLAGCLVLAGSLIWYLPPMTARLLIGDQVAALPLPKPAEGAYAAIAIHFLPTALVGMVFTGMCAATMSALDGGLIAVAGNITQNIYPAACRALKLAPLEGRARLLFARLVNVLCATAVVGSAAAMARLGRGGGIFKILMDVMATIGTPIALPLVLGLFLRRVPLAAPFVAIAVGLSVSLAIYLVPLLSGAAPWSFQSQIGWETLVGLVSFLLVRALWRPSDADTARELEFFSRRDRPVDFTREIGPGNDGRQLRIVGAFGTALGLGTLLLLLPASSAGHAGMICAVAAATSAIGGAMILAGRAAAGEGPSP